VIRRPPNVRITDPAGRPTIDPAGVASSIQAAELTLDADAVDAVLSPAGLDRLGTAYWRFLTRVSLGLIRIVATGDRLLLVLVARPLVLLAFATPDYQLDADRGSVAWPILGGLLAAPDPKRTPGAGAAPGLLRIELRRVGRTPPGLATIAAEVAVVDFRPAIAARLGRAVYSLTQARIHVALTHAFLRSLARLRPARPNPDPLAAAPAPHTRDHRPEISES
jgi:hypothetical protein